MALNYNGTSPTEIIYNGTSLTVLKYGTTAVWGKPYSLSISAGANTTVTVTRTSSPNQNASTGTLSSGSVIYYGDVLTITATADDSYNLSSFTVNGSDFTSGNTITVESAITVETTAEASASWKTIFTGNASATSTSTTPATYFFNADITIPENATKFRITGNYETVKTGVSLTTTTFSNLEFDVGNGNARYSIYGDKVYILLSVYKLRAVLTGTKVLTMTRQTTLTLAKVEAYY